MYYLKIHLRNLFRRGNHTFLNMFGFTAGITLSLLIFMLVKYEYSFDAHVPNRDRIYRVVEYQLQDVTTRASTALALSNCLRNDFAEIDLCVGFMSNRTSLEVNGQLTPDVNLAIADVDIFSMFGYRLLHGEQPEVLNNSGTAIVSESFAVMHFDAGHKAIGKTFTVYDNEFEIKGVIEDIPSNSLVDFDVMLSEKTRYQLFDNWDVRWWHGGLHTFLTFHGDALPEGFQERVNSIQATYYPDYMLNRHEYRIIPFKGSHFNTDLLWDLKSSVSPRLLTILSVIALSVLLIACLNFINISFASALRRSVYTGIKKINGANRLMIIRDSLVETSFLVIVCVAISFFLVNALIPHFNQITGRNITSIAFNVNTATIFIASVLLTVLMAGFVPALFFSTPTPLKVIRGYSGNKGIKTTFHTTSVLVQFSIALVLLICLSFFYKQIWFMKNHELGFDRENLLVIDVSAMGRDRSERNRNAEIFKEHLEQCRDSSGLSTLSITEFVPGFGYWNKFKLYPDGDHYENGIEVTSCAVDENYLEVFSRRMIMGRFFNKAKATDREVLIINETAMKQFGWDDIENKYIGMHGTEYRERVIGVINDINIQSLQTPISPMIYRFGPYNNYPRLATIRVNPDAKDDAIALIGSEFSKLTHDVPFTYYWVSDRFESAYAEEEKLIQIIAVFSFFTLMLSLLGVFALSLIVARNRTKEIGIRKVNGARVLEVLSLLNGSFLRWVLLAFVVACPLAIYIISQWLQQFAYKTSLSWWVFALAGLCVLLLAMATVTLQSWRAARRNPVEALRYE